MKDLKKSLLKKQKQADAIGRRLRTIVKDGEVALQPEKLGKLRGRMAAVAGKLDSNLETLKRDRIENQSLDQGDTAKTIKNHQRSDQNKKNATYIMRTLEH